MTIAVTPLLVGARRPAPARSSDISLALLGLGQVGAAIARLAVGTAPSGHRFRIASALVRDVHRDRSLPPGAIPLVGDPAAALAGKVDVVVEVLGGREPARSIVLDALSRGIPVVTANKSLLASHGDELFAAASRSGTPLLYEASVLAGVPFLSTFGRRPRACEVTGLSGILNGTSNYILSRMAADRAGFGQALADAQRLGYAEADPSKDVDGVDSVEKLCVLLRHFAGLSVAPAAIETTGIRELGPADVEQAAGFGGSIRPIVHAQSHGGRLAAFAGPAFVPSGDPLCRVDGVQNALTLRTRWSGDLFFSGPGAGPAVTASTVLDDVVEALDASRAPALRVGVPAPCDAPETGWFVRIAAADLGDAGRAPALLRTLGVRLRRTSGVLARDGAQCQWLLTEPHAGPHVAAALDVLAARTAGRVWSVRALD